MPSSAACTMSASREARACSTSASCLDSLRWACRSACSALSIQVPPVQDVIDLAHGPVLASVELPVAVHPPTPATLVAVLPDVGDHPQVLPRLSGVAQQHVGVRPARHRLGEDPLL